MKSLQRVFVTSAPGASPERTPCFVVPAESSDEFVAARVRGEFGAREDGSDHEWAAYNLTEEGAYRDAANQPMEI